MVKFCNSKQGKLFLSCRQMSQRNVLPECAGYIIFSFMLEIPDLDGETSFDLDAMIYGCLFHQKKVPVIYKTKHNYLVFSTLE